MGSSFVRAGEHGFWMNDSMLELWLRLAALHLEDPQESGSIATQIRDQWLLASRGYFGGCVPISIGEDIATPEGKRLVRGAIESLQHALSKAPGAINTDALNLLGIEEGRYKGDIETWRLIDVGQAFLDLIDGKIKTTAGDIARMPGYLENECRTQPDKK